MSSQRQSALIRLSKELEDLHKNPPDRFCVGPIDEDMFHWQGVLTGPEDSPYEGGLFKFRVTFPNDYPMSAPSVAFMVKVYHPNVNAESGAICLDILGKRWSASYTITEILMSISSLLTEPNPGSALNGDAARLWLNHREQYNGVCKVWVRRYASAESLDH